ncbi:Putative carboxypeptidase [Halomicronema hongdechloris C2206]|uniref:Carboxypeptidase n=1 Tax=Halomicronema hongdechloris C2206 TaxID=1641165 RepID=A0A1Z3HSI2_9CYAN|nr:LD-carboxypeptidase [Halomicronema hongdechloris]ASC73270.1 Putative carboxypeptidase [Halomicronema hongdechloris C2206]
MRRSDCQLPPPLQPGDCLRVIAPSGALRELEAFQAGVDIWRRRGYRIELSPGYDHQWGYLAGHDAARRQQLQQAWLDPDCRGILCARGGFGGTRLLEAWRWPSTEPKWLIGFSDITSLLWSLAKLGIAGVHGPLLTTLAQEPQWSRQRLFDWIEGRSVAPLQGRGWHQGKTRGRLLPANLTVATHLLGTADEPDLDGVILALEDVTEAPYRIDRLLTHWRASGKLQRVGGIALGRFSRCLPAEHTPSFSVAEVLCDRIGDLGIPVVSDLPFGHDGVNAALPVGVPAELNGDQGQLTLLPTAG